MVMLLSLGAAAMLRAQEPGVHYLHQGAMPPGAIGKGQLQRGGPLRGFFQPVEIKAPPGALVSLAAEGQFAPSRATPSRVGLLIGEVYRLRVMNLPLSPGLEVFPTIEVIDRLYAPPPQQQRFAIPVQLTREDLQLALAGKFVTRVIYLEDPETALPLSDDPQSQNWFEAGPGRDPLAMADAMGRPVAILRMGAILPDHGEGPDAAFLFGCPPFAEYPPRAPMDGSPDLPGKYSSNPSKAVRSDRIHAVFRRSSLHGPDESGHYERVGRMLTLPMASASRAPEIQQP